MLRCNGRFSQRYNGRVLMNTQDVLAVVSLSGASKNQQIKFMNEMLDRNWRATNVCRGGYVAAFPREVDDERIVTQSEREISECASLSGIDGWDAVCVMNDADH